MTRPRKQSIIINVSWDDIQGKPAEFGAVSVTFENLDANGAVGTGTDQVARGDHDHDVGNMALFFENKLI
jgi:hypothetical protein